MLNYRPISIIPVFAKLFERLMCNSTISFLYKNKIFPEAQNGFRNDKCIETAVQSFVIINKWMKMNWNDPGGPR